MTDRNNPNPSPADNTTLAQEHPPHRQDTHRGHWKIRRGTRQLIHLSWPWLVLAAYFVFYMLSADSGVFADGDTFLHIRIGQWIWENGQIPHTDVFSYTATGQSWVAHEWLAGLLMASLNTVWGMHGLYVAMVLCGGTALAIQTRFLLRHLPVAYALPMVLLAALAMHSHQLPRPHAYTWPILAVWFCHLWQAAEERRSPSWWLLPLMTLWANLHGGFVVGLALVVPGAMLALYQAPPSARPSLMAQWLRFGVAGTLAACVNPQGWRLLVFVHEVNSMVLMKVHMSEWRPEHDYSLGAWTLALLAMTMASGLCLNPIRLVCVLVLWSQAFEAGRFIALLGLLAPFVLAEPLGQIYRTHRAQMAMSPGLDHWLERLRTPSNRLGLLLLVIALSGLAWFGRLSDRYQRQPHNTAVEALSVLREHGLQGHGLNAQIFGGYLILQGIPVFIDGRVDMYGEKRFIEFIDLIKLKDEERVEAELSRWQIQWALLTPTTRLSVYLSHHPKWRVVYQDEHSIAFIRREAGA